MGTGKNLWRSRLILAAALAAAAGGAWRCGTTENVADCTKRKPDVPCSPQTELEQASEAMNSGDFTTAIQLLTDVIANEPGVYTHYPLLGAAYAARSGLDILNVTKAQFGGSGTFLTALSSFLPTPATAGAAYPACLTDMSMAVTVLSEVPAAELAQAASDKYAASAVLQLALYHASYAAMVLNQFVSSSGTISIQDLSKMSEDQALSVVANLAAAGQLPAIAGAAGSGVTDQVAKDLATINAESGATTKDKLAAFLATQNGGTGTVTGSATGTGAGTSTGTGS